MTKSTITGPKTRTSQAGAKLACIWVNISLRERGSVWFRSKKRPWKGIFGFDRARNLARTKKMKERGGGGEGRKRLRTNPSILKTCVRQRTQRLIGSASRTTLTCVDQRFVSY